MQPWLWFLTRTADCRIFQDMTVPEIVKKVFEDHGIAKFEFKTFRTYRKWVYCVQYRESDYNFVARLLEQEGIYWYFEHGDGEHKLLLVDSHSVHDAAPSCDVAALHRGWRRSAPDTDCVFDWRFSREVRSGKVALTSYDFERPSTDLKVKAAKQRSHTMSDYEEFDFQGDYIQSSDGTQLADDWMDELQTPFELLHGSSNAQGIEVGRLLKLAKHPRADQNAQYLITGLQISAQVDAYESGQRRGRLPLRVLSASRRRSSSGRRAGRPSRSCRGRRRRSSSARAGEEIFTDKYGRVKVQFHWDRYGKNDEKSSCWVRVSHPWAGKNWGVIHIPRIGQEVIVDFLEGDPDQPIIIGRVYNADQMPPWALPANATQSRHPDALEQGRQRGELQRDPLRGQEGQRSRSGSTPRRTRTSRSRTTRRTGSGTTARKTIDHDETTHVKHDRTETVDNNETITIHGKRTETVDKDETITIHKNRTETVDLNEDDHDRRQSHREGGDERDDHDRRQSHHQGGRERDRDGRASAHARGRRQRDDRDRCGAGESPSAPCRASTVGANQTTRSAPARPTRSRRTRQRAWSRTRATRRRDRKLTVGGGADAPASRRRARTSVGKDDTLSVGKNLVITPATPCRSPPATPASR